jgi:hypothetical protein
MKGKSFRFIMGLVACLALILVVQGQQCNKGVEVIISTPSNGATVGMNNVSFTATFGNITDQNPKIEVSLDSVAIAADGEYLIKDNLVAIEKFSATFAGVSFLAWNLPIGAGQISVTITQADATTGQATSIFTVNDTVGISFGDGRDGNLTVSTANTVINKFALVQKDLKASDTAISVDDSSGFKVQDEVMIIQLQGGTYPGMFEFQRVQAVSEGLVTLSSGLLNPYKATTSYNKVNVVSIPHYKDVTITGSGSIATLAWNSSKGGVVAFRSNGKVNINGGGILATGMGYRGGEPVACWNTIYAYSGESYNGPGAQNTSANNGGGGGAMISSGGGGGGFGVVGSDGVYNCPSYAVYYGKGGLVYGKASLAELLLGSGGGSGGDGYNGNWCQNSSSSQKGGSGGGIIKIYAYKVLVNAPIRADGGRGYDGWKTTSGSWISGGGGGGGAGGSLYISARSMDIVSTEVTAKGGAGGDAFIGTYGGCWSTKAPVGGKGGDGRARIDYEILNSKVFPDAGQGEGKVTATTPAAFGGGIPAGN